MFIQFQWKKIALRKHQLSNVIDSTDSLQSSTLKKIFWNIDPVFISEKRACYRQGVFKSQQCASL